MNGSSVALCSISGYDRKKLREEIQKILEWTHASSCFKPQSQIMIKPNFIKAPGNTRTPRITDPELLMALTEVLLDLRTKPFIADSPAWGTTEQIAKESSLFDFCKKNAIPKTL